MTEFDADELSDFTRLKGLREAGYFESEGSVPMPEIVSDGEGPDDGWLPERRVPVQGQRARTYAHTSLFCNSRCQRLTQHRQVATYENTNTPVFHCNICCVCHLCLERLSGAQRLYEAVNDIGDSLAAWDKPYVAEVETPDNPTFCPECGTALIGAEGEIRSGRCSACVSIEGGDAS